MMQASCRRMAEERHVRRRGRSNDVCAADAASIAADSTIFLGGAAPSRRNMDSRSARLMSWPISTAPCDSIRRLYVPEAAPGWSERGAQDQAETGAAAAPYSNSDSAPTSPPYSAPHSVLTFGSSDVEPVAVMCDGMSANRRMPARGSTAESRSSKRRSGVSCFGPQPHVHLNMLLILLLSLGGPRQAECWIALSKDGYIVTRGLGLK